MIFYFTGTGNSLDAALQLQGDEELVNITDCIWKKNFHFALKGDEAAGFVFPVYFGGVPSIVQAFLSKISFEEPPAYIYAVITCGGDMFGAGNMTADTLLKNDLHLDAVWQVEMPDNYIFLYEPDSDEDRAKTLAASKPVLAELKEKIENRVTTDTKGSAKARLITSLMYPLYVRGRKTKKFWTDDQCVGCGTCAKRCPAKAIVMENGRPKWIKDRCIHCMTCIRCGAVQYGKKTVGRPRYKNPVLKQCH